jgi:hypothetical protein
MDPYLLNQSLHKDFHYTLSLIFDFLKDNYGKEEMDRVMRKVSGVIYSPLIKEMKEKGLSAIEKHMEELMGLEGGEYEIKRDNDSSVTFKISRCPAIDYMKSKNMKISEDFCRVSTGLASKEIAEKAGYKYSVDYDQDKGQCVQKFWKE